jgi:hypothetical protein
MLGWALSGFPNNKWLSSSIDTWSCLFGLFGLYPPIGISTTLLSTLSGVISLIGAFEQEAIKNAEIITRRVCVFL